MLAKGIPNEKEPVTPIKQQNKERKKDMTSKGERTIARNEKMAGGEGYTLIEQLLSDEERGPGSRMFAEVTIEPGSSLGYHEHHGESETYYILSGQGMYQDNGTEYPVKAGDVVYCGDGGAHGVKNTGSGDLKFIALILKQWPEKA